ncbi:metallophosphoesterase [Bdellovibrio sp. SKB1291214]|uniref:metallophosphoesterase family protein n=1 Tax=Bdellovibrio sp. SKB1291214 TaxID=1732569 RepID=UPI000B51A839|nr:metallophosphoesterase [Bdellovibrio sp. SKB1291214]UYL08388.1 metallophosphoesterase [Bdellovibrio sp. SKB1291214]
MKRVLHISDLHFGRINPPAIKSLEQFLQNDSLKLDLIIMTGDWTQRARRGQYKEAQEFVKKMPVPVLTIPGNHDIPLYNFVARLVQPLANYNKFIRKVTKDSFQDSEIAAIGFRTASAIRTVEGRILEKDILRAESFFKQANPKALRIIACHHPIFVPELMSQIRPKALIQRMLDLRPHVILSGHSHLNWIELVNPGTPQEVLHISAGSATSNRLRGEVNNFHVLEVSENKVKVETYFLGDNGFIAREDQAAKVIQFYSDGEARL